MDEATIRAKVNKWARLNNVGHIRMSFRPGVPAGVPDDQYLLPGGIAVFIEFKRPGKEPTALQWERLERVAHLGFACGWFDDANAAISALASILGALAVHAPRRGASDNPVQRGLTAPAGGPENLDYAGGIFVPQTALARINSARHSADARVSFSVASGGNEVVRVPPFEDGVPARPKKA